jgi:hypothetical protein
MGLNSPTKAGPDESRYEPKQGARNAGPPRRAYRAESNCKSGGVGVVMFAPQIGEPAAKHAAIDSWSEASFGIDCAFVAATCPTSALHIRRRNTVNAQALAAQAALIASRYAPLLAHGKMSLPVSPEAPPNYQALA